MWVCRFFLFTFYESPKNLLARGYKDKAVDSLNKIAAFNNSDARISIQELCHDGVSLGRLSVHNLKEHFDGQKCAIRRLMDELSQFGPRRLKPLFATKRMGWTTLIVWFIWIDIQIGNAFPRFN